jgi:hypothetical protein
MVQQIFQEYSGNQEELSYEEWKKWFCTLDGVQEVLYSDAYRRQNTLGALSNQGISAV